MTEQQTAQRFVKNLGSHIPKMTNETMTYWDKMHESVEWFKKKYPNGEYTELIEKYYESYFTIACIEHMIWKEQTE